MALLSIGYITIDDNRTLDKIIYLFSKIKKEIKNIIWNMLNGIYWNIKGCKNSKRKD